MKDVIVLTHESHSFSFNCLRIFLDHISFKNL